jgi:hypothetical protein
VSEFLFISRRSITVVPFNVYDANGDLVAADAPPTVSLKNYADDTEVFAARAMSTTATTGVYEDTLSSVETQTPGLFYLEYSYNLSAVPQTWRTDVEIPTHTSSAYEALSDTDKAIVEQTWLRFADMFDSAIGGPHLQEYAQSNFGRERLAQLLQLALNRINTSAQPATTYTLAAGDFPYTNWGGLLEHSLYIEAIRHLIRSYTEQPNPQGLQTVRLDRSNYAQFWRAILSDELPAFESALDNFKIASLNLGRAATLVAGGIYGEYQRPVPVTRPRHQLPVRLW